MLPLWADTASTVQVVQLTETEEIEAIIRLFEGIADKEGWQPEGALRLYLSRSVYFALFVKEQLVGGLQLVLPDTLGTLPCQTLWTEVSVVPLNRTAHIAILALEERVRGWSRLFWHLAVEMWRYCVGEGITKLFFEVTPRVLPLYQQLGWPLTIQGEKKMHWGEDCYLCMLGIPEVAEALLRRAEQATLYQQIIAQAFRVNISTREGRGRATTETILEVTAVI